jgi:hypothetical protein
MKFNDVINIEEEIKNYGKNNIVVFDIDDCILHADSSMIKIWKIKDGKETSLSTDQFAKDPDKGKDGVEYSYREFRDPVKVRNSIINGTPIIKNLKILDANINAGYKFAFLTARGLENVVAQSVQDFVKVRDKKGNLRELGDEYKKGLSAAVNDDLKVYPGANDPEKKANILRKLCSQFDRVKYIDDDIKNVTAARALRLPNLQVIQAHKYGE